MNRVKFWLEILTGKREIFGFPLVTVWIIVACCLMWLVENLTQGQLLLMGGMIKAIAPLQPWRYLTYIFLHAPMSTSILPLHLLLNMYSLWIIGRILENYLGRFKFLITFLLCGVGASVFSTALTFISLQFSLNIAVNSLSIGASGAIMGLFALLIFLFRRLQLPYNQLIIVLLINLAFPFFFSGIDWVTHICGFATGAFLAIGLGYTQLRLPSSITSRQLYLGVVGTLLALFAVIEILILAINY
jgi:membrane associated rhomboid family serine protease